MYWETKKFVWLALLRYWLYELEVAAEGIESLGFAVVMFLQYYYSGQGDPVYTLKKPDSMGQQTHWAYTAQFSLDDKCSQDEITIKKCFKVLVTQQPRPVLWGSLKISYPFCCLLAPGDLMKPCSSICEPWSLATALASWIQSHPFLWSCLLWGNYGSILFKGKMFESSFHTLNHCQVIKMIWKRKKKILALL